MTSDFQDKARRLRNTVEPAAAGVYVSPEAHAAYAELGFGGSPVTQDGVARPDLKAYFTSRGACMGQVPGEVVASAFGCFNPKVVVPAVGAGWQITSREAILQARERAAAAMLRRVLGDQPEGLVFDVNDFDETLPGPRERDAIQLAASLEVAARDNRFAGTNGPPPNPSCKTPAPRP